jgi:hypothetical protein
VAAVAEIAAPLCEVSDANFVMPHIAAHAACGQIENLQGINPVRAVHPAKDRRHFEDDTDTVAGKGLQIVAEIGGIDADVIVRGVEEGQDDVFGGGPFLGRLAVPPRHLTNHSPVGSRGETRQKGNAEECQGKDLNSFPVLHILGPVNQRFII